MTGYAEALRNGADVVVKVDGDGQMDPGLIPLFVAPIVKGQADYTKGNRFYDLAQVVRMPARRLAGNALLSLVAKLSTGYWNLFDVTNGFTAIHAKVLRHLPMEKISERYFFETDLLFRLNTVRAVVVDIPMDARVWHRNQQPEDSQDLSRIRWQALAQFQQADLLQLLPARHDCGIAGTGCRISHAAVRPAFRRKHWARSITTGTAAPMGTIMLAALPTLVGLQLLLAFVAFDVANMPRRTIHVDLPD
jgi:dolichol-phosphate mannosyltransferase